jgi:cation-transporting ATPase 13A2
MKYGKCVIDVPIKPIPVLLLTEILNPYYVFLFFTIALWFYEQYYFYVVCIIILSFLSSTVTLIDTVRNLRNIKRIAYFSCPINVMRSGDEFNLTKI